MYCLNCKHKIDDDSIYCDYCGSQRVFNLNRSIWILISLFLIISFSAIVMLAAGIRFGLKEVIIALAPGLAWSADVLLKWAFGLSTRSSGADLTFGAFSASAVLLVVYPSKTMGNAPFLLFGSLVLGFLWLFNLVMAAIADAHEKQTTRSIKKLSKFIFPDHAMWFSLFLGFFSAFSIAYLTLVFGG
jgi:hypothetical protein